MIVLILKFVRSFLLVCHVPYSLETSLGTSCPAKLEMIKRLVLTRRALTHLYYENWYRYNELLWDLKAN